MIEQPTGIVTEAGLNLLHSVCVDSARSFSAAAAGRGRLVLPRAGLGVHLHARFMVSGSGSFGIVDGADDWSDHVGDTGATGIWISWRANFLVTS